MLLLLCTLVKEARTSQGLGFRVLGFRVLGFRASLPDSGPVQLRHLALKGLVFRVLGFRVCKGVGVSRAVAIGRQLGFRV